MSVTMKDIAREAGVARSTVSMILNNRETYVSQETKQRILDVAKKLNYRPNHFAKSLKDGKTNIIGITTISTEIGVFDHQYPANVYSGIAEYFSDKDYRLIFHNFKQAGSVYPFEELTRSRIVDGIILLLFAGDIEIFKQERIVDQLHEMKIPAVVVHSVTEDFGCPAVGLDTGYGGYIATKHLLEHGYQDKGIGQVIFKQEDRQLRDIIEGYKRALAESGVQYEEKYDYVSSSIDAAAGYQLAQDMTKRKDTLPRALMVFADEVAFGMIAAFREAGIRVPEDIALVGIRDDNAPALLMSGLTTVHEPAREKGGRAGELLMSMLSDQTQKPNGEILKPKLIIRTSCGCHR